MPNPGLTETEKAELMRVLSRREPKQNGTSESRREKIRAFREKVKAFQERFRATLPSTEEFMREKRAEVELEERKWHR